MTMWSVLFLLYPTAYPEYRMVSRKHWQARASQYGDQPSGVLFSGLPDYLNRFVHTWHTSIIRGRALSHVPPGGVLLDLGCGYGRIAVEIKRERQDVQVIGMDYIHDYCRYFRQSEAGLAVCGDLSQLPFRRGAFDCVVAVTTLMYLPQQDFESVAADIIQLVKPNGVVLFIDPTYEFITFARMFRHEKEQDGGATGGSGFRLQEYRRLCSPENVECLAEGGNPGFTVLSPLLMLVGEGRTGRLLLGLARYIDTILGKLCRLTVHRWILLRRH